MTRNLKTLGLALVAALALSAVVASGASAAQAQFTATVGGAEQGKVVGGQVGTDTFTLAGLPSMTCVTATEEGFPEEAGKHKVGPSAPSVTLAPTYNTCHIVLLFVTRTVTVTTNGCDYTFTATKNTGGKPFTADLTICPDKEKIEIHVYNTSNHNDTGAAVLCTYDVNHQTINNQIELTNNNVATDDILAHINATVAVTNTILSGTCGNNANTTAVYKGTHTLQATDALGNPVHATVS